MMSPQLTARSSHRKRGAVLVEAAAATVFLLLPLLLGIIQFGLFYSATNGLSQVAREGGRYAAVYGLRTDGAAASDDFIKDRMVEVGKTVNLVIAKEDISITPVRTSRQQYTPINVAVKYNLNNKRILPFFNPGEATRTSTAMLE